MYVLPLALGQSVNDIKLVVPLAVQMGWKELPAYFCAVSETAQDVAEEQCTETVGLLPHHLLEDMMLPQDRWPPVDNLQPMRVFNNMLEVYVDNFCAMAQSSNGKDFAT